METNVNALNWFEIPATDVNRAQEFYEGIFDMEMAPMQEMMGMKMVSFPTEMDNGKVSGALVESPSHKPSNEGTVVYLNANPDMQAVLGRVEELKGTVIMPKTEITPEIGYMAFFIDTEGNKIGLHSQN